MTEFYHAIQQPLFILSKICKTCGIEKTTDQFYRRPAYGYQTSCKACVCSGMHQKYLAAHPPVIKPTPLNGGKICMRCCIEKPLINFSKDKQRKDGLQQYCKACVQLQWREHKEKQGYKRPPVPPAVNGGKVCTKCLQEKPLREFGIEKRRQSGYSPRCKECLNEGHRANYAAFDDKEKILAKNNKWYEDNKERHHALVNRWGRKHRLRRSTWTRSYFARKRKVTVEVVDYEVVRARDGNHCYICNSSILPHHKIDFDHVIPLSRGGAHSYDNVKVTHLTCNRRKSDKLLTEMTPHQRRGVQ